jgi:hypothetical protein
MAPKAKAKKSSKTVQKPSVVKKTPRKSVKSSDSKTSIPRNSQPSLHTSAAQTRAPSRFRSIILPVHPLDLKHRDFLSSLQMSICYHSDVGRVLVTERTFSRGETVLSAKMDAYPMMDEQDLKKLVGEKLIETGCFIQVPRKKLVLFNKRFDLKDPVKNHNDLWYLLNHNSHKPNCELKVSDDGLIVQAKRTITHFEPLTWAYNSDFFEKHENPISLPSHVVIDRTTISSA